MLGHDWVINTFTFTLLNRPTYNGVPFPLQSYLTTMLCWSFFFSIKYIRYICYLLIDIYFCRMRLIDMNYNIVPHFCKTQSYFWRNHFLPRMLGHLQEWKFAFWGRHEKMMIYDEIPYRKQTSPFSLSLKIKIPYSIKNRWACQSISVNDSIFTSFYNC